MVTWGSPYDFEIPHIVNKFSNKFDYIKITILDIYYKNPIL